MNVPTRNKYTYSKLLIYMHTKRERGERERERERDDAYFRAEFVGIHWRRGDRALEHEMGMHGFVDVVLTDADRLVDFAEDMMAARGLRRCVPSACLHMTNYER